MDSDTANKEFSAETLQYNEIMQDIASGMAGDPKADWEYLNAEADKYKDHEMSKEILRGIGRLISTIIPEGMKEKLVELEQKMHSDFLGLEAIVEEAHFNIYKQNFPKALELIESAVAKLETEHLLFQDDRVSEYRYFRNPLEELLYRELYKPEKEVRYIPEDHSQVYFVYGNLLYELKRYDEAVAALKKAMRVNPVRTDVLFELGDLYKRRQQWDDFLELSKRSLAVAYKSADIARAYRDLGFYFSDHREYDTAAALFFLSTQYAESPVANSELYYIIKETGKELPEFGPEEVKQILSMREIQFGVSQDVLGISYAFAQRFEKEKNADAARFFYDILYDLTHDDGIRKKLEGLGN